MQINFKFTKAQIACKMSVAYNVMTLCLTFTFNRNCLGRKYLNHNLFVCCVHVHECAYDTSRLLYSQIIRLQCASLCTSVVEQSTQPR